MRADERAVREDLLAATWPRTHRVGAEDGVELDTWHARAAQQVVQHGAGADGGQLVVVAHHEDVAVRRQRVEERAGEVDVEHRRLVDDDRLRVERVGRAAAVALLARVVLEQSVDGRRGRADRLRGRSRASALSQ